MLAGFQDSISALDLQSLAGESKFKNDLDTIVAACDLKQVFIIALSIVVGYLAWEQLRFALNRRKLSGKTVPGPSFPVPLLGCIVNLVKNPYEFWEEQRKFSYPGFSYNSILGQYMVFTTDAELSRRALSVNSEDTLLMGVHPSAKHILGPNNLAFMHGPDHKAIRKSFVSLFTRKALSTYVELQDKVIRNHIQQWLDVKGEREIRPFVREMNHETSLVVFVGPYLDDPAVREKVSESFKDMTNGFLAFPLCFPGTAVWKGKKGRMYIVDVLTEAAQRSKDNMQAGKDPCCLMDFWAQNCLAEIKESQEKGTPMPKHVDNKAMADTVMDFLFASQDASTASLVWSMALMSEYPDVLAKVREEQLRVRKNLDDVITGEVLGQMTYTRQVIREILRYRAPAPMVPQIAQRPFKLTDDYSVPKGGLIMPSLITANWQGFSNAMNFDPDRFSPQRKEDITYQKNFLTFGCGPHYCVGREYAMNHLACFLAIFSTSCDWDRRRTPDSDKWLYLPTIYPADSLLTLRPRD